VATRIGVDVGGTFTDLIFYDDESGEVRVGKVPTTPASPDEGVRAAVGAALTADLVRASKYFLHGTTVGLNSLLTRTGAVVGLLATEGFRDILEVRRGDRPDPYDLFPKLPAPLVPRRLRIGVPERMLADGTVHRPIEVEVIREAVALFAEEGVESVAVAFLHAYANPAHELAAEEALRDFGFTGEVSLSHRVSGEYREYERTTTTVIDAYVRPRMASYLRRLEEQLGEAGFEGSLLVTRSGGGAMTFAEAEQRPFETILSGPVAGAEGAAELARTLELGDVISADVGGTSFDTCLITGGRPQMMYEGSVAGLPVQTPWVDVRSIGAGGGSLAYVDVGGLLRVGPGSAGADPGPACYARGGTQPTVTDAAFVLGMLGEGQLAGGVRLDLEAARAALAPLAEKLSFEIDEVARGILLIANANMANAIREITVEQGVDPRRTTLVAFGGAGPLFATLLARELEIKEMVVPPHAGNFSAWGLLGADLTQSAALTRITRLDGDAVGNLDDVLSGLFGTLVSRGREAGTDGGLEIGFDMRYVGQEHTLTVGVPSDEGRIGASVGDIHGLFTREYERTFGHSMEDPVEVVSVRATVRTLLPRRADERRHASQNGRDAGTLEAYSFTRGEPLEFAVLERAALPVDGAVEGPAIVLEDTATTYVDHGFTARLGQSGMVFLTDEEA
jgi:N-methylhydantoinase A